MSCRCGHGPWHHHGYTYPPVPYPPAVYPPTAYPPVAYSVPYSTARPMWRGRRTRAEDLEAYLSELEDELARSTVTACCRPATCPEWVTSTGNGYIGRPAR